MEVVEVATHKSVAGAKTGARSKWRGGHQVRLAVFREDAAAGIDEHLRIVNV
jgi:hypothetical protein